MKRGVSCVITVVLIMSLLLGFTAGADASIKVTIDSEAQVYDVMPVNFR